MSEPFALSSETDWKLKDTIFPVTRVYFIWRFSFRTVVVYNHKPCHHSFDLYLGPTLIRSSQRWWQNWTMNIFFTRLFHFQFFGCHLSLNDSIISHFRHWYEHHSFSLKHPAEEIQPQMVVGAILHHASQKAKFPTMIICSYSNTLVLPLLAFTSLLSCALLVGCGCLRTFWFDSICACNLFFTS